MVDILISFAFKAPGLFFKKRVLAAVGPTLLSCLKGMLKKGLIADVLGLLLPPTLDHLGMDVGALRGSYIGEHIHNAVAPIWGLKGISTLLVVLTGGREILLEMQLRAERMKYKELNNVGKAIKLAGLKTEARLSEDDDFRNLQTENTKKMAQVTAHLMIARKGMPFPGIGKIDETIHIIAHIISDDFNKQMDAFHALCRVAYKNREEWHNPDDKELGIHSHKKDEIRAMFAINPRFRPLREAIEAQQLGVGGMLTAQRYLLSKYAPTDSEGINVRPKNEIIAESQKPEVGILAKATQEEQDIIAHLIKPFDHPDNWPGGEEEQSQDRARLWPFVGERPVDHQDSELTIGQLAVLDAELEVGSSRVDLQACKLEYSIVSPK